MRHVRPRITIVLVAAAAAAVGAGTFTALQASASTQVTPATQPTGQPYVFACVNENTGQVDYFEFRSSFPHRCNSGDELWHLAAAPAVLGLPCASPSPARFGRWVCPVTVSPSSSPSPSPSSPSPSPSLSPSSSSSSS